MGTDANYQSFFPVDSVNILENNFNNIPVNEGVQKTTSTFSSIVIDEYGNVLPLANVKVNGVPTTQTNSAGFFYIKNTDAKAIVTITYVGMGDLTYVASDLPKTIYMKSKTTELPELVITIPKKNIDTGTNNSAPKTNSKGDKNKINWWLWLGIGATGVYAYKNLSSKKTIKAKI
ncbi:hypothetical protein DNC80_07740 [Flavobacterium sp. SOK18b]|nr:hypothetical protein [Flavobacterium sp. SOK18b]